MEYNTSATPIDGEINGAVLELQTSVLNSTCNPLDVPSIDEYFTAFNELGLALFTLGGLAVMIVFSLYADTLRHVIKHAPPVAKTHTAFVITVYPVVAIATYCATIVPRAQLLAEAVTQGMFMFCLYQLFCLVVSYCGGEAQMIKKVHPTQLSLQVAPCCCWPCCMFPTFDLSKKTLLALRLLVLQLPVVQGLTYMVLMVMWAEEQSLYQVNYNYFQPLVICSILLGMWGMIMTIKVSMNTLKEYNIQGKFIALQLVLLFAKFQAFIAKTVATTNFFPCKTPITPTVYANLIYNSVLLWEMVLLCAVARALYRKTTPDDISKDSNSNINVGSFKKQENSITVIKF